MISPKVIESLCESGQFERMVGRLLANGRCRDTAAVRMMLEGPQVAAAAIGLGLQRLCELSYWPLPSGDSLAAALVRMQRADGLFGPGHTDPHQVMAGSAAALRGLIEWVQQFMAPECNESRTALARRAIDRAWNAIGRECASEAAARDESLAIVLWQLGDCEGARQHLPIHAMRERVRAIGDRRGVDDLARLALMMAA